MRMHDVKQPRWLLTTGTALLSGLLLLPMTGCADEEVENGETVDVETPLGDVKVQHDNSDGGVDVDVNLKEDAQPDELLRQADPKVTNEG